MTSPDPTGEDRGGEDRGAEDRGAEVEDDEAARRRAARDRRRRQVFGDVLDDATLDDRPEPGATPEQDRWLRDNVPPHHGE